MGMVDLGDGSAPATPSKPEGGLMGSLLDAVTGDSDATPKVKKTAAAQVLAEIDTAISTQVNAIMNHTAYRRLEAAWRGLKFLVDKIDFRKNIYLEVLAAGKADLSTALYHQVLIPEHSGEVAKPPLSLITLDTAFDNSSADLALLDDLADTGASLQAPILAAAGPAFFGVDDYAGVATLPPLRQLIERPEYIPWNKLRERKAARYLALVLPAFLLRAPYGKDDGFKAFNFEETGHLWGNATLATTAAVARSFAQTGWPTHFMGTSHSLENLPLWKSRQGHTPLSVLIPDARLAEFSKGGFGVLGGKVNHDALYVARAMTVCQPEAYEDLMAATEARIHVTLGCTLFVARAAQHLLAVQATLTPGASLEQAQKEVTAGMRMFFHTEGQTVPPDAVEVQAVDESGVDEQDLLAIRLKAPRYVLERPVSLVMGLPVPKSG